MQKSTMPARTPSSIVPEASTMLWEKNHSYMLGVCPPCRISPDSPLGVLLTLSPLLSKPSHTINGWCFQSGLPAWLRVWVRSTFTQAGNLSTLQAKPLES
ncbi:hypothetical protein KIL84_019294 [Mauremys mutica]|uniref:Uncharacterized protein n=1 Tax=Mauremys mutica TaxID=74926 RepID=A0A9D3XWH8_9SAUR|nr:hypothetical protein KIL84_019294 [Mauremys mutica]